MLLFLNTADLQKADVALVGESTFSQVRFAHSRDLSRKLLPQVKKLLAKNKLQLANLKKVIIALGPGGFSSTRTGVATALGLALGLEVPVFGIKIGDLPKNLADLAKSPKLVQKITPLYHGKPNITRPKTRSRGMFLGVKS